ncbi:olfactory receptor 52K2-like [Pelobates fuscus]|uniref:olfactory receptor 52K2-like n=1 Tax=Pelobates fuscus TaxID=191477 RepID=UPI002FE479DB
MELSSLNQTFSYTEFILFAFPGVSTSRYLLAIPFSSIYIIILISNSTIICQIIMEKTLHTPMYILISLLLSVNLTYSTSLLPKMILSFFGVNQISLFGCLAQMFSVYSCIMMESILMLLMAFDRYIAITRPLHYWEIITKNLLVTFSINGLIRNCFLVFPLIILSASMRYCKSNIIPHFHCENQVLLQLACGDISKNLVTGLFVRTFITVCDVTIIIISYLQILQTAMKIAAGSARKKALHTCSTHIMVVSTTYLTGLLASILYFTSSTISYNVQNLCSAVYFFFPPTVNPFIFGLRMNEIKESLLKPWRKNKQTYCNRAHSK